MQNARGRGREEGDRVIGDRLGAYEVLSELGSGGMGTVYLAELAEPTAGLDTGTRVALKILHPHLLGQPGTLERFLREARVGQDVRHANVVRTFCCGATEIDGAAAHFLVMEYVEGQTLRDLLSELDRVPEELCRHIGREVAKGLAAIHEAGVIHRDLKPENVLITDQQVVKVMDLGVARLQDEAIRLSQTGAFVGSLEYAAPEQLGAADDESDGRADLYALGVVLYELATGGHPYRAVDIRTILRNILESTPPKVGEVNPQLSPFFEEVVQVLIAKDPPQRFRTASELATVLEEGERSVWWQSRATALRLRTRRPLRRIRIPRTTALFGRDGDLAKLRELFDKANAGNGQVLLIEGEAGIGKTRLVDEFVGGLGRAGEDINFVFGSYPPGGAATAAGAFAEAYREQFGAQDLEATLEGYLTPTPILIPAFAAMLRCEPTPRDAVPLTAASLQTVFVHATRGLAAERTTVVLIDDLHFAPEDGRALFSSLAMAVPGSRVLLLGTMRPGLPEHWTANLEHMEHVARTVLARLGPKDLSKLLKDAFRSERLAHELGMKIAEKSDGNPFFALEIIRGLREGQFISQRPDGTWVSSKVIEELRVPSSLLDLVNARVADLSEEERDLLDVASCCGFEFDPLLVADVLGLAQIPAMKRLALIEKKHRLIRSAGANYTFDHHQVQESVYAGLHERLKQPYHAGIAAALEVRCGAESVPPEDLDGAQCVAICEHYLKGAQGEKALRYLDAGLDHLSKGLPTPQTIALADRALAVDGLLADEARLRVLMAKSAVLERQGSFGEEERALIEARSLVGPTTDRDRALAVERAVGVLLLRTGRYEEAREQLDRVLVFARDIGDKKEEAGAMQNLGGLLWILDRYEEAYDQFRRARRIAQEAGDVDGEAGSTGNMGLALWRLGRHEEAAQYHRLGLELARKIGDRTGQARAAGNLGVVLMSLGRHEEAKGHLERRLEIARAMGDRIGEAYATGNLGVAYRDLGRYEEAKTYMERVLEISREIGDRKGEATSIGNLGTLFLLLGRPEEAKELQSRRLELARAFHDRQGEASALADLGFVAREQGDDAMALELAGNALELRREIRLGDGVADSLLQVGEFRLDAGDTSAARGALLEATDWLRKQRRKGELACALALLARLTREDCAAAEAALEGARTCSDAPRTRYHLFKATRNPAHLREAKRLLDFRIEHAPKEYRESMLTSVRMHRAIMDAWAEEHRGAS